jgi:hypothetical protein
MDVRFGTWNVWKVCTAGSLETDANELAKFNSHLVAVQEVRYDNGGSEPADDYIFFYGNGNSNRHLGTGFFIHTGIISAVKMVEFIRDRMSCVTLRGRWCDITLLNVHASPED